MKISTQNEKCIQEKNENELSNITCIDIQKLPYKKVVRSNYGYINSFEVSATSSITSQSGSRWAGGLRPEWIANVTGRHYNFSERVLTCLLIYLLGSWFSSNLLFTLTNICAYLFILSINLFSNCIFSSTLQKRYLHHSIMISITFLSHVS